MIIKPVWKETWHHFRENFTKNNVLQKNVQTKMVGLTYVTKVQIEPFSEFLESYEKKSCYVYHISGWLIFFN